MISIFSLAGANVSREEVCNWLKKEDQDSFMSLYDVKLSAFLNGFIAYKRGKKDGDLPVNEKKINNNLILRKLKIALQLKDDDMLEILQMSDMIISKHELSAFFRKPGQKQYRMCKDQIIRKFLYGLQKKYRPAS
jgi:uncharacterized protein YehS (DUF1456 family)